MTDSKSGVAVILASHGYLAKEALRSAEMIVGKQDNCAYLAVTEDLNLEQAKEQMNRMYDELDTSKGTIILCDILGGTPSNVSGTFCLEKDNILVLSGLNLPMLLDLFTNRDRSLNELADSLKKSYDMGFQNISARFKEEDQDEDGSGIL
ncbi:MAG: PTS sugar transporter subunit IIA [Lactobacillus sp.]|jgi:mannose PTS system EIIA component|uniref:PTS sugar transporter subunit IIA n=1 Tax=unclassified Lactobacillus TaxID=2620435 RepID=UPI0018DE9469|nr:MULTISPECIES: PTS sugar transporter subunit IIA [unclassified Lactobacillus]MBH9986271.1 PTS sugar transporter subunit IIA [Lactobacillus sp. M0390]MBI0093405.1 PTS sugar transporter subunit IIA [Lactobacillus sp. M0403]MCO6544148.1 PTS sugar transporter subunit IIA [Lactobacillus sp.]